MHEMQLKPQVNIFLTSLILINHAWDKNAFNTNFTKTKIIKTIPKKGINTMSKIILNKILSKNKGEFFLGGV